MRTLLRWLVFLAVVGGLSYGGYVYFVKDKVVDETSAEKACQVEKGMIEASIEAAVKERQETGLELADPSTFIDKAATLEYYTWEAGGFGWIPKPIGTPPC